MNKNFRVLEIFGPTIQGEGKFQGTPSLFVRFAGCNLRCIECDTAYSREAKGKDYSLNKLLVAIQQLNKDWKIKHVVLSGGEPAIQKSLKLLITALIKMGYYVTIESNGTFDKREYTRGLKWVTTYLPERLLISLSPKMRGLNGKNRIHDVIKALRWTNSYPERFTTKIVISALWEVELLQELIAQHLGGYIRGHVYLQPNNMGKKSKESYVKSYEDLVAMVLKTPLPNYIPNLQILMQNHYLVWGRRRCI